MNKVSAETIGFRIRRIRLEKGMTQQALAGIDALKVQRNLVNYWENDERDIKSGQIIALADFFGVTCDYLLRGAEAEHADIHKETGLRESAIQWLREKKDNLPLYVEAFNLLFECEDNGMILSDALANSIVQFCMSKYITYIEQNHALGLMAGQPMETPLDYEYSRMLLLSIGQNRFARILERLGERWDVGTGELIRMRLKTAEAILKTETSEGGVQDAEETPEQ